ncbi:MAG TPA: hypothetical protein VFU00_02295, partial [Gemmatimonadales bacterium]|nr:hypothetical protein [Gemmatimonadales bacterium]
MRHRSRWWVVMVILAVLAAAEWLRMPATALAWAAGAGALAAAVLALSGGRWLTAALAVVLGVTAAEVAVTQRLLISIAGDWPAQREARIEAYGDRVGGELRAALREAVRLAAVGAEAAHLDRSAAFERLAAALPRSGIERAVVVLDSAGGPWAWAGRHRVAAEPLGDSIAVRSVPYYVILETRRHSAGRVAVASVLIWADSAVPDRERSLAERFRRETEVGLLVYPPGAAPEGNTDIFDYVEPTTEGRRLLFSVQPVPPLQEEARARVYGRGGRAVFWLAALALALALLAAPTMPERAVLVPAFLWLTARAPAGELLGLEQGFSGSAYSHPLLGALSSSPAALLLSGLALSLLALWLGRRSFPRSIPAAALGVLAALGSLLVVRILADGITPPPSGTPVALWLAWQAGLMLAGAPLALLAAALLAGSAPRADRTRLTIGVALAAALAAIAIAGWRPEGAWPAWLPLAWIGPLLLVVAGPPRLGTALATGAVLGSLAAALTWDADIAARLGRAERDVARLGSAPDPEALALLEAFSRNVSAGPGVAGAPDLFALWSSSDLYRLGYPARLTRWRSDGALQAELPLDSLALPREMIGALALALPANVGHEIRVVPAVPGVHSILLQRLGDGGVL